MRHCGRGSGCREQFMNYDAKVYNSSLPCRHSWFCAGKTRVIQRVVVVIGQQVFWWLEWGSCSFVDYYCFVLSVPPCLCLKMYNLLQATVVIVSYLCATSEGQIYTQPQQVHLSYGGKFAYHFQTVWRWCTQYCQGNRAVSLHPILHPFCNSPALPTAMKCNYCDCGMRV